MSDTWRPLALGYDPQDAPDDDDESDRLRELENEEREREFEAQRDYEDYWMDGGNPYDGTDTNDQAFWDDSPFGLDCDLYNEGE